MSLSNVFDFIWNAPLSALGLIAIGIILLIVGVKNTRWWIRIICFGSMLLFFWYASVLLINYGFTTY